MSQELRDAVAALAKAAFAEGIVKLTIRVSDIEDARRLGPEIFAAKTPVKTPHGPDRVFSWFSEADGVTYTWPNVEHAQWKDPRYSEKQRRKREKEKIRAKAEELADEARSKHLDEAGYYDE